MNGIAPLQTRQLHPTFGVEIIDVDLRSVSATFQYPDIRAAFEEHSVLLFRGQDLDDEAHLRLGALFGPIEDRSFGKNGPAPRMDNVSNRLHDGTVSEADSLHTLNLMANQLWHTDSTFLPTPALANILAARVLPSSGGETEYVSTRVAWAQMPSALKRRAAQAVFRHRIGHSRAKISAELGTMHAVRFPDDQRWRAIWPNPLNRREALYIASHVAAVEGLGQNDGEALVAELSAFCTEPHRIYRHAWQPGDVLIWDERATMHRGRPWPYDEERTLGSICVTATEIDGLATIRPDTVGSIVEIRGG